MGTDESSDDGEDDETKPLENGIWNQLSILGRIVWSNLNNEVCE
jgi:hypothetical protein